MSTGLVPLDAVLGGLFWGDNVVWQLDGTPVAPFYRSIAGPTGVFDAKLVVSLGDAVNTFGVPGLGVLDAAPHGKLVAPGDLLREIRRLCHGPGRRLVLFESLDIMVRVWGQADARGFFARCCPLLLEAGAVAYWCMSARDTPAALRDAVIATTQCVLRVDERSLQVVKAEGRDDGAPGTVLHWHDEDGQPVLSPPEMVDRVASSLRAIRHARELSQHDLGDMAGVTASAISQVERAEHGLSLATVARLSAALGVTIDDLLHGEDAGYRIGRRPDDPRHAIDHTITLLADPARNLRVDLVRLQPGQTARPPAGPPSAGIVAVAAGLIQVTVGDQTPTLRHGEVLIAASDRIDAWRNLGPAEAVAFWIVATGARRRAGDSRTAD